LVALTAHVVQRQRLSEGWPADIQINDVFGDKQNSQTVKTPNSEIYSALTSLIEP